MNTTANEHNSRMPDPADRGGAIGQADAYPSLGEQAPSDHARHNTHGGHRLAMLICCIPMIAVAVLLVTTGVAGSGALLWALGCLIMMAMMMFMMRGEHTHK